MTAIGMGLLWAGYWLGLSGVSIVKGWNNNPWQLANPLAQVQWSTACYTGTGILPSGNSADSGPCSSSSGSSTPTQTNYAAGQVAGVNPTIANVAGRGK